MEQLRNPEEEVDPRSFAIATTTMYPQWYPGPEIENDTEVRRVQHKVRGDLAIQSLSEAKQKGFQVVVVDGGSPDKFRQALSDLGIESLDETERGMSGGRRQAFREASQLEECRVICWVEPEKLSIIRDCLPEAALPIIRGEADVVIPKRDQEAFATYPQYQVGYEQRSNERWNKALKTHLLLDEDSEELDVLFGPRFIKNSPEVLNSFFDKYEYKGIPPITPRDEKHQKRLKQIYNPELWPNAWSLPIIAVLRKGLKVVSVEVPYSHPARQTDIEVNDRETIEKRDIQSRNIVISTANFIKYLEGRRSRIVEA